MGCSDSINNTLIVAQKFKKMTNYESAILEILDLYIKVNSLNQDSYLECYLINVQSIPNFFSILNKYIQNTLDSLDLDATKDLEEYELEKNIQIYDNENICKEVLESNDGRNEFILAGDTFEKEMEISQGNKVKIEKINSELKISFNESMSKMIFVTKTYISFKFTKLEAITSGVYENINIIKEIDDMNRRDSFLLSRIVDSFINIDYFKEFFLSNQQKIKQNINNYQISNIFLDMIGIADNEKNKKNKKILELSKLIEEKGLLKESNFLIQSLIRNFNNEFDNSISFSCLFSINNISYFFCSRCNTFYNINNSRICTMEFNLDNIRNFCGYNKINLFNCFNYKICKIQNQNLYCYKCNNEIISNNIFYKIQSFPKILVIILDRNNNHDSNNRIEFDVEYNINLNYISYIENINVNYCLVGFISYKQDEYNGHYIAFCKEVNSNKWICYDQYYQNDVNNDDMKDIHTPFILFYSLQN